MMTQLREMPSCLITCANIILNACKHNQTLLYIYNCLNKYDENYFKQIACRQEYI